MKAGKKEKKSLSGKILEKQKRDLGKRVKELKCLYGITKIMSRSDLSLSRALRLAVNSIPQAWQYPDAACARIKFDGQQFKTKTFKETRWGQFADIRIGGKKAGSVEVCYLQKKPAAWEGPFLKEERDLLNVLARQIEHLAEHRIADEKLRLSEKNFKGLIETSPDWIWEVDKNGAYTYVSPNVKSLLGYEAGELLGKTPFDLMPGKEARRTARIFRKKAARGEPFYKLENINRHKDGHLVVLETSATPIFDEKGRLKGYRGVDRDITDRKEAEESLQLSEQRFRQFFENQPSYCYMVSPDGIILDINGAALRALGYKKEYIVGKPVTALYAPESHSRAKRLFEKWRKAGTIRNEEIVIVTKTGERRTVLLSVSTARDAKGKIRHSISVQQDITLRKRALEQLALLNKELVKSNKKLKQLAVRDSHTGLYSHRFLEGALRSEYARAERYGRPLSLIMLDIDYFKSINDVYGHRFGDTVLKQFATQLKKILRASDIVIRFGGEEFVILVPETDAAGAARLGGRILDFVSLYNFGDDKRSVKLKLSIAACSYPEDDINKPMDLLELADKALNKCKELGGNRVCTPLELETEKVKAPEENHESAEIRSLKTKIDRLAKRASQSMMEAIFAFAKTIELKDDVTGKHIERTVQYAKKIAEAMNLPEEEVDRITQAATLHDLGKVGISEKILRKKAVLTRKEWVKIKKHPQIGVDIIRPIQALHDVIPLVLHHHERWDGKGYPRGLKGKVIPIGARVIAVADAFQALTSKRPYRNAYSKAEAIKILKQESGVKFDPEIVDLFLELIEKHNNH